MILLFQSHCSFTGHLISSHGFHMGIRNIVLRFPHFSASISLRHILFLAGNSAVLLSASIFHRLNFSVYNLRPISQHHYSRSIRRSTTQWRSQLDIWSSKCKFFREMNNDNDLNLHSMTKLSGWLRYCKCSDQQLSSNIL